VQLYLHVPFCRRLCWFCACRTQGTKSLDPVIAYLDVLRDEIAMLGRILPEGVRISGLHWGGGTPTLLPPDAMRALVPAISEVAEFAPGAEVSVEIDPNEIDEARLDALVESGMTRASIGVQDFDPEIQQAIGRSQSEAVTEKCVRMLRDRGIASLNADILYGLPMQTPARIEATVRKLLAIGPDRVALYGYAHVPWMARRQVMIPAAQLPGPQERLELFETARAAFLGSGYRAVGIDHFARPEDSLARAAQDGGLRRNFQGYVDHATDVLIGLGASSISRFPQGYAQNAAATSAYMTAIREGRFSTARGHVFAGEDQLRARMIEALMCDFSIDRAELIDSFGADPEMISKLFDAALLAFPGCVSVSPQGLSIPEHARAATRIIARQFDAYDMSRAGHSLAV
jgi:oxygen-independent coproporphyrinogen-3 oxidase